MDKLHTYKLRLGRICPTDATLAIDLVVGNEIVGSHEYAIESKAWNLCGSIWDVLAEGFVKNNGYAKELCAKEKIKILHMDDKDVQKKLKNIYNEKQT